MSSATQRSGSPSETARTAVETAEGIVQRTQAKLEQRKHALDETIIERPGSAVLLGFVLGAGVGTLVGAALFERRPQRTHHVAENLARRIADSVSRTLSENLPNFVRS